LYGKKSNNKDYFKEILTYCYNPLPMAIQQELVSKGGFIQKKWLIHPDPTPITTVPASNKPANDSYYHPLTL
jgi:hypothetical protein